MNLLARACLVLMPFGGGAVLAAVPADCPDLSGTYDVGNAAWIDRYHLSATGTVRPKSQAKQFATFVRDGDGFTLTWHMPRETVLATVRGLAERDPRKYGLWLDMVMRDPKLPLPYGVGEQEWANRMANLGPVFRVDATLRSRHCKDGWLLFGSDSPAGAAEVEGGMSGTRDAELWLSRDKDGALALKWQEYKTVRVVDQRYFNVPGMRLWSSESTDRWTASPAMDLAPLRADELPPDRRPRRPPSCQVTEEHETAFYQRLKASVPPRVQIENFSLSIVPGRRQADGACDGTPYTLTVSAPDAASVAKVADFLRADPHILRIDSQATTQPWGDGTLQVKFSMMALPR